MAKSLGREMLRCLLFRRKTGIQHADEDYLVPSGLSKSQRSEVARLSTETRKPLLIGPESSITTVSDNIEPGPVVTIENARRSMVVMRGPDWKWDDEDGGRHELGDLVAIDEKSRLATVRWRTTNKIFGHYRLAGHKDLCMAEGKNGVAVQPLLVTQVLTPKGSRGYRDSQGAFSDPAQTVIVFDWDDTLFPTKWIRTGEDVNWRLPIHKQKLSAADRQLLATTLDAPCLLATNLLRLADSYGHPVIVTLARRDWVRQSCNFFYRSVGAVIRRLKIPIVYAREEVDYDPEQLREMEQDDVLKFLSEAKGAAIRKKVQKIYSDYEGQTWKNVISIGDSTFERDGVRGAVRDYLNDLGVAPSMSGGLVRTETHPHIVRVRTKTIKFVEAPNIEELCTELGLLTQWLPLMVGADHSFDIDLDQMEGPPHTWGVEETLRNGKATSSSPIELSSTFRLSQIGPASSMQDPAAIPAS